MITMIFQVELEFIRLIIGLTITVPLTTFIIGMYTMRWYAKKMRWNDSIKIAFIINFILLIPSIPINLLVYFIFGAIINVISLVINIAIGILLVMILFQPRSPVFPICNIKSFSYFWHV